MTPYIKYLVLSPAGVLRTVMRGGAAFKLPDLELSKADIVWAIDLGGNRVKIKDRHEGLR